MKRRDFILRSAMAGGALSVLDIRELLARPVLADDFVFQPQQQELAFRALDAHRSRAT
jgi:indole-3-glycerol phosphate synthase